MILYLGTSSLVKLYAEEAFSGLVREWVGQAEIVATCRVAYAEIIYALNKRFENHDLSAKDYELISKIFAAEWRNFAAVDFDEFETGRLIKRYGLHRLDAIHLSAAKLIRKERGDISFSFSSASIKLCRAAALEGLRILSFHPIDATESDYLGPD